MSLRNMFTNLGKREGKKLFFFNEDLNGRHIRGVFFYMNDLW